MPAAGIAYYPWAPQPRMSMPWPPLAPNKYVSETEKFDSAWHAAHCTVENCERCQALCDSGQVIACDECGHVHHTDWAGWTGILRNMECRVLCPECDIKQRLERWNGMKLKQKDHESH